MARYDDNLGGYQVAQNQLLAVQQEQQQNLMAAQAASSQSGAVNQVAQQAAGLLTANQEAAINANVNPETRGILQRYGVGKPQTVRDKSQRTVGQNVIINNNTTTNNYGGPVQGRELSFNNNNNIAMKKQAEETNRFKAWLSGLFNKQQAEDVNRNREFSKRARTLEKQSDQLTKKLGEMGKGIVDGLSPKRIVGNMNSGLKRLLMIFGFHLLATNWSKILQAVANIESKVRGWISYLGIGDPGKKVSGFISDLRKFFMGKDAANSNKSFLEYLKDMFVGDDKKSVWGYIKLYFEHKRKERVEALSKLTLPELSAEDLENIPRAITKLLSYLGDVISISINGTKGFESSVKNNITRTARNRTFRYNEFRGSVYNSTSAVEAGAKERAWKITDKDTGKSRIINTSDVGAGDFAVAKGHFKGLYKGHIDELSGHIRDTASAKLGQGAELSSLLDEARHKGKRNTAGVTNAFNELYSKASDSKLDLPLPAYLINDHVKDKAGFLSRNKNNIKTARYKYIFTKKRSFLDSLEEDTYGAAGLAYASNELAKKIGISGIMGSAARAYADSQDIDKVDDFDDTGIDRISHNWNARKRGIGNTGDAIVSGATMTLASPGDWSSWRAFKAGKIKSQEGVKEYHMELVPEDYVPDADEVDTGMTEEVYVTNKAGLRALGNEILGTDVNSNFDMGEKNMTEIEKGLNNIIKQGGFLTPTYRDSDAGNVYKQLKDLQDMTNKHNAERAERWQQTTGHEALDKIGNTIGSKVDKVKNYATNTFNNVKSDIENKDFNLSSFIPSNDSNSSDATIVTNTSPSSSGNTTNNTSSSQGALYQPNSSQIQSNNGYPVFDLDKATKFCRLPKNSGSDKESLCNGLHEKSQGHCARGVYQILKHGGLFPNSSNNAGCNGNMFGIVKLLPNGWFEVPSDNFIRDSIPGDVVVFSRSGTRLSGPAENDYGHVHFLAKDNCWYSDFKENTPYVYNAFNPDFEGKVTPYYGPRVCFKLAKIYRYCKVSSNSDISYNDSEDTENNSESSSSDNSGGLFGNLAEKSDKAKKWLYQKILDSGMFKWESTHQIRDNEVVTKELTSYEAYRNTPESELKYLRAGMSKAEWAKEVKTQTGKSPSELIVGLPFKSLEKTNVSFAKRREANGFYEFSPINKSILSNPEEITAQAIKESNDQSNVIAVAGQEEMINVLQNINSGISNLNNTLITTQADNTGAATPTQDMTPATSAVPADAIQ